ncbi:hypothetical protein [Salinarimonas rosea]|uniref:hypothetical protein n=1 Tax=Salinarimonas rosea TaxID=552063 RepID=UPI000401E6DC|nr:hypothetical protein [Salinarimonas rosea]
MIDFLLPFAFAAAGVATIAFALLDIFRTTLTLCGAGPVTKRITAGTWVVVRRLLSRNARLVADGPPDPPSTDALARAGLPLAPPADYDEAIVQAAERRCTARGIVEESGWDWRAIA